MNHITKFVLIILLPSMMLCSCSSSESQSKEPESGKGFPFKLPTEKPDRPLSKAMERNTSVMG